jgi:hypothetical protein
MNPLIKRVIKKTKISTKIRKEIKIWSNYTKLLSILNLFKQMKETKVSNKHLETI